MQIRVSFRTKLPKVFRRCPGDLTKSLNSGIGWNRIAFPRDLVYVGVRRKSEPRGPCRVESPKRVPVGFELLEQPNIYRLRKSIVLHATRGSRSLLVDLARGYVFLEYKLPNRPLNKVLPFLRGAFHRAMETSVRV